MNKSILISIFLIATISLFGQETEKEKRWSVQLNLQHQDLSVPITFGQLGVVHNVKIRPLYSLDFERSVTKTAKKKRIFSGQISYHNNIYHEEWLSIKLGFGRERTIYKGLFVAFRIEPGIAWVKESDVRYKYEDGKWIETKNALLVNRNFTLTSRIDLGYRVVDNAHPIDVLISTNLMLLLDFNIGILPYYATGVGVRYGF